MGRLKLIFVICAISFCFCEIDINKKAKLVNGFVEFYNRLPNEIYTCDEGFLQSAHQTEISNAYDIEASLKVSETHNPETVKYLKCTATVVDLEEGVAVMKHHCEDDLNPAGNPTNNEEEVTNVNFVTEADVVRRPVQLDNEVQTDTAVTSGEQFIAIPREEPKVHCIGCSSHVNPQAQGVNELADVGIRQLNSLQPEVQHTLISVVDVERQVQVVNGVRYILTLLIDHNTCSHQQTDTCSVSKACKVTILEKPWLQLSDGAKYRAILANNCTKEWRFGDDGVVPPKDNKNNDIHSNNTDGSDIIKVVHNLEVQSHQQTEKSISDQEVKNIEEQIIPFNQLNIDRATAYEATTPLTAEKSKHHVESKLKEQSENQFSLNSVPISKTQKVENLDADKKKTIDDLLNYFNFVGFDPNQNVDQARTRTKRSFENDLNTIDIAEKYHKLKKNIENAKHIYTLAQSVVDYLNEMDLEVKNRILKHVITAEMESDNANNFFYIQFRTILPCTSRVCKVKDAVTKICNAVVENSEKSPHILNVFCHDEHTKAHVNQMNSISSDDPMLLNLIQETILKIETESGISRALKLNKIIDANIHRSTYILTKISMLLDQTDCDKNVPYKLRVNCTVVEEYGSDICDVTIHERRLLQERSITYSCTERPIDVRFSINYKGAKSATSNDPVVLDMIQESLRNLENQSNRNNKQMIIKVNSVSTQLVAGFLTQIEFVVGITTCPIDVNAEDSYKCKLLKDEPLKICTAKVWDRTWVNNERQVEVFCKEPNVKTREPTENPKLSRVSNPSDEIKVRAKSNLVGGEREQEFDGGQQTKDPNDPEYKKLAQESLQKYLQDTGNSQTHKLVSVKKVTTQVVAGTLTRIDFEMCPEGQTRGDVISCHSEVWEKPWEKFKNITVSCQIDNVKTRTKREFVGGQKTKDPNDPEYRKLAQESLQKYLQDTGNSQTHKLVSVKKVTTQVVAGTLTRIDFEICPEGQTRGDVISCHSEVWEKPWEKFKNITVSCQIDNVKTRTKREFVGGQKTKDPNDPEYKKLAQESLQKYLQDTGNSQTHKLVSVKKVTTQVVAGTLTRIDFEICPEGQTRGDVISCHSEVWEKPWEKFKNITVSCQIDNVKTRTKREFVGGQKTKDPNDPEYKKLAQESLQKYLQDTGNSQTHKLVSVKKVTTQVVAGTLTRIDFEICPEGQTRGDVISCHSEVWEKPWEKFKNITVSCQIDNVKTRTKREFVGGQKTKDPNDPEYKKLAQESLQKYLQDTGNSQTHKLVSVKKVTTQVVAGTLTRIDFEMCPEGQTRGDVISCHSEVWEKPWEKFKNITVSCQIDNVKTRTKREFVGGQKTKDPNDPEYRKLAQESLQKYLQDTGNSQTHKLVSVKKVTTQVVAGTLTRIDFEMCPEGQTRGDVISCHSEVWEKPWEKFKNITVSCQIDNVKTRTKREFVEEGNIDLPYHKMNADKRAKRHVITGGLVEQNPNKLKYRELAKISLQKFLQSSSCSQAHKVIKVDKAFTQVVSGLRTVISFKVAPVGVTPSSVLKCSSEIWQKPWENTMKIAVNCNIDDCAIIDDSDANNGNRSKRNVFDKNKWVGGPQEEDPSDEKYKEFAREALQKYQKKHKATKNHIVVKVKKVIMQVVSGTIYNIDFTIADTSCADDVAECDVENPVLNCHSRTKLRPWLLVNDITVSCSESKKREKRKANLKNTEENSNMVQFKEVEITDLDERGKRQAGIDDDNLDDDTKFYYADRAIEQLNQQQRSNNLHKLITVHAIQSSMHMDNTPMVRIYFEAAETYCLRGNADTKLVDCEELDADNHKLCLARVWPSPDDEMVVQQVNVVCDDHEKFESVSGLSIASYLRASLKSIEQSPEQKHKLVHLGEPQLIPSLDSNTPMKLNFIIGITNCSKHVDNVNKYNCYMDTTIPARSCSSYIWLTPNSRTISKLSANCAQTEVRSKRSVSLDPTNATADDLEIQKMVHESLAKLEMTSPERYKLKVLKINGYKSKVTSGKVTTIDFDVAFTSCLKFEWIDDIGTCEVLEHLPKRHCVAEIWERLWLNNGRNIEVSCQDEEVPIEAHVEFQSASTAMALADRALKHIEAKYPHPRKQKVIRIYSMDKQVVAGVHYRMKMEVGLTNCSALSAVNNCVLDKKSGQSKFCRVNVWLRPWTDHPPNFRVSCDYQEGAMAELFHQIQAEHLFRDFLTTYDREYVNDHEEVLKRFQIFKNNIQRIHELNTHERGTATYGVTRFADMTYEEFTQKHMGLKPSLRNENQVPMARAQIPDVAIPDQFDWREHGAVTEVKNQGSCGSCWAFSVTGNIEGQWQLKTGKLVSLSEQELVDCDKMDDGCNGGLPDNAYRAIEQLGGLELESDYPYEGEDDKCAFNKTMAKVQITSAVNITSNETDMAKWLVEKGPISIGINANAMQFYMGGVSHPWKMLCNPKNLDHGVLIVGYGVKDYPLFHKQLPYWTVKNSWGPSWGEQGYYRVFRGDGTCGLNLMASSAVV